MITIVDYGLGNVQAFVNLYKRLNIEVCSARTSEDLAGSEKLILPGVGSFDWAMKKLEDSGMRDRLNDLVIKSQVPVLGICVGMQLMGNRSEEGSRPGLSWIRGEIKKLRGPNREERFCLPHMGWNDAQARQAGGLFRGLEDEARFYFLHSFYFAPEASEVVSAVTDYGGPFASAISWRNVFGVQFHPEKSHQWGIQILKNFAELQ